MVRSAIDGLSSWAKVGGRLEKAGIRSVRHHLGGK